MDLVKFLSPKHVMLVHGEKPKMAILKEKIQSELGIKCFDPANKNSVSIPSAHFVKANASKAFNRSCLNPNFNFSKYNSQTKSDSSSQDLHPSLHLQVSDERVGEGVLILEKSKKAKVVHQDELLNKLGEQKHEIQFAYCCPVRYENLEKTEETTDDHTSTADMLSQLDKSSLIKPLVAKLSSELSVANIHNSGEHLQLETFHASICSKDNCPYRIADNIQNRSEAAFLCCSWLAADENLARKIISIMENCNLTTT